MEKLQMEALSLGSQISKQRGIEEVWKAGGRHGGMEG